MTLVCTSTFHRTPHAQNIPPALWARGALEVVSIKIASLPTLSPGLRSGPSGSVAGKHRFRKNIQNAERELSKAHRQLREPIYASYNVLTLAGCFVGLGENDKLCFVCSFFSSRCRPPLRITPTAKIITSTNKVPMKTIQLDSLSVLCF